MTHHDWSEAEYQNMYADDIDCGDTPPKSLSEKVGHWRTRDGRILEITTMASEHLTNAITAFTRAGWSEHFKIRELRDELAKRSANKNSSDIRKGQ